VLERNWLLIFDNAESWDTILPYWPRHPGSAILTSRDYRLAKTPASGGEELLPFDAKESFDFFTNSVTDWSGDDTEVEAAKELLAELDGHALAMSQIAGHINSYQMSVQEFLDLYKEESAAFHSERSEGEGVDIFYPKSLAKVWNVTFDNFSKTPSTFHFLGVLCLLSPSSIPQELFEPGSDFSLPGHLNFGRKQRGYVRFQQLEGHADENPLCHRLPKEIQKLRTAALVQRVRGTMQIHRLTQTLFLQHVGVAALGEIFDSASLLLAKAFPKQRRGDPMYEEWEACQLYIQHGQSLAQRFLDIRSFGKEVVPTLSFVELMQNCAWYVSNARTYLSYYSRGTNVDS
jgi:hypothetical protein